MKSSFILYPAAVMVASALVSYSIKRGRQNDRESAGSVRDEVPAEHSAASPAAEDGIAGLLQRYQQNLIVFDGDPMGHLTNFGRAPEVPSAGKWGAAVAEKLALRDALISFSLQSKINFGKCLEAGDSMRALLGDEAMMELLAANVFASDAESLEFMVQKVPRGLQQEWTRHLAALFHEKGDMDRYILCQMLYKHEDGRPGKVKLALQEFKTDKIGAAWRDIPRWPRITLINLLRECFPARSVKFHDQRDDELYAQPRLEGLSPEEIKSLLAGEVGKPGWQMRRGQVLGLFQRLAEQDFPAAAAWVAQLRTNSRIMIELYPILHQAALIKGDFKTAKELADLLKTKYNEHVEVGGPDSLPVDAQAVLLSSMKPENAIMAMSQGEWSAEALEKLIASKRLAPGLEETLKGYQTLRDQGIANLSGEQLMQVIEDKNLSNELSALMPLILKANPHAALEILVGGESAALTANRALEGAVDSMYKAAGTASIDPIIKTAETRPELMPRIFSVMLVNWVRDEPAEAGNWMLTQDLSHPLMQQTLASTIPKIAMTNGALATELAGHVSDRQIKEGMMNRINQANAGN